MKGMKKGGAAQAISRELKSRMPDATGAVIVLDRLGRSWSRIFNQLTTPRLTPVISQPLENNPQCAPLSDFRISFSRLKGIYRCYNSS
jgi:hypothetical protein